MPASFFMNARVVKHGLDHCQATAACFVLMELLDVSQSKWNNPHRETAVGSNFIVR